MRDLDVEDIVILILAVGLFFVIPICLAAIAIFGS